MLTSELIKKLQQKNPKIILKVTKPYAAQILIKDGQHETYDKRLDDPVDDYIDSKGRGWKFTGGVDDQFLMAVPYPNIYDGQMPYPQFPHADGSVRYHNTIAEVYKRLKGMKVI